MCVFVYAIGDVNSDADAFTGIRLERQRRFIFLKAVKIPIGVVELTLMIY